MPFSPDNLFRTHPPEIPDRLVDVHVNVGISDAPGLSYGRLAPDDALRLLDASGVTEACAFPPLMDHYAEANQALAGWAATTAGRVLPFARLGGPRPVPVRAAWQARKAVRSAIENKIRGERLPDVADLGRYAGVKMIPHLSGVPSDDVLEEISARELPVLVHAGSHVPPRWIEKALLPKLRGPVIVAHLGAFPAYPEGLFEAIDLARRVDRVWLDTCGVWLAAFMQEAARRVPEKLLFGSDAPLVHPRTAWLHTALAVRDDAVLERIAWRNALDLFSDALASTSVQEARA